MYSPVFLSWPTTSGSPPVLSISLSDHSFSALASSFACTLAHSRSLWRLLVSSKRAFKALRSSSRCSGDKSFLLLLMFRALVALIVVASRVSYLLLRCDPPHGGSFGLSLCSYQFAVSTPSGVRPHYVLARRRQTNMRGSHFSPAARNRQENLGHTEYLTIIGWRLFTAPGECPWRLPKKTGNTSGRCEHQRGKGSSGIEELEC